MCVFIFAKGGRPPLPGYANRTPTGVNYGVNALFILIYLCLWLPVEEPSPQLIHGRPGISGFSQLGTTCVCVWWTSFHRICRNC